ncbi:MAG: hypothetical protein KDE27_25870, partial [Planctomycetes bacterium]|nr:hypothetical protein [Planctomycetota bacterium]
AFPASPEQPTFEPSVEIHIDRIDVHAPPSRRQVPPATSRRPAAPGGMTLASYLELQRRRR